MAMSPTLLRPRRRVAVPPPEGSAPSAPTGISLTTAPLVPTALTLTTAPSPPLSPSLATIPDSPTSVTLETGLVAPTNVGLLAAPKNLTATEVFAPDSPTGLDLTAAPASPTNATVQSSPAAPTSVQLTTAPTAPTNPQLTTAPSSPTGVTATGAAATDPYFSDVVLLLQDSLTDESPQGQTITALGGASFTTTNPKVGTHSLDIVSSGHITTSAFPFGTGDYTLEMWFYQTAQASQPFLYAGHPHTANGSLWVTADFGGGGGMTVGVSGGGTAQQIKSQVVPALNQWNHFAVCRESGGTKIFLNGNLLISSAAHSGVNLLEAAPEFGNESSSNRRFPGYIDAIRITKAARYSQNFTPPTSAFPATNGDPDFADVVLLLQDSLADESLQGQTVTAVGGASFTATNPKVGTHSLSLGGGSDRLILSPGPDFAYGDGDFCVEAWFYQTNTVSFGSPLFAQTESGTNYFNVRAGFSNPMQTKIDVRVNDQQLVSTATYTLNSWHHVAVVRQSGVVTIYLDGQAVGSATMSSALNNTTYAPTVGSLSHNALNFSGYIDALRITKAARYTTNFTPPTSAFPATNGDPDFADVVLLLQDSLTDESPQGQTVTANGDAAFTTTNPKVGTHSLDLDGEGDYLSITTGLDLGTGDFTVEFWFNTTDSLQYRALAGNQTSTLGTWQILLNSDAANDGTIGFWVRGIAGAVATTSGGYNDGSWHHFAAVRSGTTLELFVDGASEATATNSSNLSSAQNFNVGIQSGVGRAYTGYIDALRITKAARYTSNFTPPTSAFPS